MPYNIGRVLVMLLVRPIITPRTTERKSGKIMIKLLRAPAFAGLSCAEANLQLF